MRVFEGREVGEFAREGEVRKPLRKNEGTQDMEKTFEAVFPSYGKIGSRGSIYI